MKSLSILNAEPENYTSRAAELLTRLGTVTNGPLTRPELLACISDFDVLITRLAHQVDAELLDLAKRLKVVVTATTGLDHVDMDYARTRGIQVLSLNGESEFLKSIPATAEHTWALLLALTRRVPAAFQSILAGRWQRNYFRGHDLAGKTLGILGFGRIGKKVARYGLAFDMQVVAYDPYLRKQKSGFTLIANLDELLHQTDVLTIHVPLNQDTRTLIAGRELGLLHPGALLVNTARGQILDESALLKALTSGQLGGAALDVIWDERSIELEGHPLILYARTHDNLLITPHIGGATIESMAATEIFMAQKLQKFFESQAGK